MTAAGVPDALSHGRLSRLIAEMKSRADTARTESVTGRYGDITAATRGDVGGAHLLLKALDDAKAYQRTLGLAQTRAAHTQTTITALTEESRRISTDVLSFLGRGDQNGLVTAAADAKASLSTIFSALNVSLGGRALFGGDAVDRPPLAAPQQLIDEVRAILAAAPDAATAEADLDAYFNDPAGGFATNIYQGGAGLAPQVEIAPGVRIDAAIKADAQPIKDMLRGLAVIANEDAYPGGSQTERNTVLQAAASLVIDTEARIVEIRASLGVAETRIAAAIERFEAEESVLTNLYNDMTARDPYEAASTLQQLEAQLEASYVLSARLANLTLSNFLR